MELIKLGSIRLSNEVQIPGFNCCDDVEISFGDTVPGQEIQWIKLQSGLLVADRCVCIGISWEQLNAKGFVFGAPITIDGEIYLCRSLRVGAKEDEPNEWDAALDEVGEGNELWHWKNRSFWGQETPEHVASHVLRGCFSARDWDYFSEYYWHVPLGFRPALEYLGSVSGSPDTLVGKEIKAYCSNGVTIEGRLVEHSDYDAVLAASSPVPANCPWITKEGRNIIVDRRNIIWLKKR